MHRADRNMSVMSFYQYVLSSTWGFHQCGAIVHGFVKNLSLPHPQARQRRCEPTITITARRTPWFARNHTPSCLCNRTVLFHAARKPLQHQLARLLYAPVRCPLLPCGEDVCLRVYGQHYLRPGDSEAAAATSPHPAAKRSTSSLSGSATSAAKHSMAAGTRSICTQNSCERGCWCLCEEEWNGVQYLSLGCACASSKRCHPVTNNACVEKT